MKFGSLLSCTVWIAHRCMFSYSKANKNVNAFLLICINSKGMCLHSEIIFWILFSYISDISDFT